MPDHGSFRSADQPEERRVREDHRPLFVASANHDGVAGRIEGVAQELSLLFAAVHLGGLPDEDRDLRRSRVGRAGDEMDVEAVLVRRTLARQHETRREGLARERAPQRALNRLAPGRVQALVEGRARLHRPPSVPSRRPHASNDTRGVDRDPHLERARRGQPTHEPHRGGRHHRSDRRPVRGGLFPKSSSRHVPDLRRRSTERRVEASPRMSCPAGETPGLTAFQNR